MAETGVAETQSQRRPRGGLTLFVLFCAGVCVAALVGLPDKLVDGLEVEARALLDKPIGITWIVGVPALLILERVFAVDRPDYRDPAVVLSIFYSLIATPVLIVTVALFLDWQNEWVTNHVAIVDLEFFQLWHPWAVGLFAFVTSDFLLWITHVIMHRVPLLWRIHEVHHSPLTLNMFAADRSHPGSSCPSGTGCSERRMLTTPHTPRPALASRRSRYRIVGSTRDGDGIRCADGVAVSQRRRLLSRARVLARLAGLGIS